MYFIALVSVRARERDFTVKSERTGHTTQLHRLLLCIAGASCCILLFVAHCWCKPRNNFNGLMVFKPISFFFLQILLLFLRSPSARRRLHRCFRTSHSSCVRFFCHFFFCYRLSFYLIHDLIAIWHNNVRAKPHAQQIPQLNSVTFSKQSK